jgi:hypothetical protein
MFLERLVSYSALFTILVGRHTSAVSFPALLSPLADVILAQLLGSLIDIIFCLHFELLTYLCVNFARYL